MISVRQVKAARSLLAWSQEDLAVKSGVSYPTLARLESGDGELGGRSATAAKIRTALEAAGVIFVESNGEGPGVRLSAAKHCALQLIALAQLENASEAVARAKRAVAAYADRELRGLHRAFNEVILLYKNDHRSDTDAGDAIFKWLESEVVKLP